MTQKKTDMISHPFDDTGGRRSTRIESVLPDLHDPSQTRLGRRESEPHSAEVTYLRDVLTTNFPSGRALWDLHHYFIGKKGALKGKKIDIQFDISFFKDLRIPHAIPSYDASKHEGRIPEMAINVLSKSTWGKDLSEIVDTCKALEVLVYVVFSPYKVTGKIYAPPFLRVYVLQDDGFYKQEDLRSITLKEGEKVDEKNIVDVSDILPFRLGLMQLKQHYEGEKPLFRLILIDPSELSVLLTGREKDKEEAEQKIKETEQKVKELEKNLQKYREKFGELEGTGFNPNLI